LRESRILIDSWVWIEYWKGGPRAGEARRFIEGEEEAYVSTINLAEVYRWFLSSYDEREAEKAVTTMLKRCHDIPVVIDTAIEAAKLRHKKKWGLGDCLIFATASSLGARIVSGDPDFKREKNVLYIG
jgi:predicted nucleic acid-binding protein